MSSKWLGSLIVICLAGAELLAQGTRSEGLRDELRNEVGRLYNESGGEALDREEIAQARRQALNTNVPPQVESAPVVVTTRNNPYVERRPKAIVESAPLDESKAARMRRQRENFEAETEMRIVEKLEEDRIESERERAARLFGDKWDREATGNIKQQAPQQVQPVAPIVVAPQQNEADRELEREDFKQDIREVLTEMKSTTEVEEEYDDLDVAPTYYIMPSFGVGSYPGINNVKGVYSLGVNLGAEYVSGLMVEGSFNFSSYDLYDCYAGTNCNITANNNNLLEMKQYVLGLNVKYQFNASGRLRPVVGGVAALNMREYEQVYGNGSTNVSSNALDMGFIGGVNVDISNLWSVTADIRYMFNITNRVDRSGFNSNFIVNSLNGATPIEELDYYIFNIGAKFKF